MRRSSEPRRVELVGQLAQSLGDDPVGAVARLLELPLGLCLGVVDHAGGGLLGSVDDRARRCAASAAEDAGRC